MLRFKFTLDLRIFILFLIIFDSVISINIINFTNEPKDTLVTKDRVSKITCGVNQDNVKYSWLMYNERSRSDQPITQNQYLSMDRNGLFIIRHHPSVVGRYRCKAIIANVGTVVSRLFRIDIADMYINKMNQKQLGSGQYKIGSRALLICPFWTVPQSEAEYRWFFKGSNSTTQIYMSKRHVLHQNGKLLEIEVDESSYGQFFCDALYSKYGLERNSPLIEIFSPDNSYDKRTSDHLVWVAKPVESLLLERKELYNKEMKLTDGKGTLIIREGMSRLELVCGANSEEGDVKIMWLKDHMLIDKAAINFHRFNYEITGQGTLVLMNVTQQYNGEYTCKASLTKKDKQIQTTVKLVVRSNLRFSIKPAPIVIGDVNKEILLSCRLNEADTWASITWRKNGELISSNSYLQQNDGFMRISRLLDSDEGIFQCIADDEFHSLQAVVQMKINKAQSRTIPDNRPLPVKNLRVKAVSYRTLNISWNHASEGFETILHYEIILIDLSNLSGNNKITLKADRLESSVLVRDLIPDSFHRIYVSAVNGSGTSYPAIIKSSPRVLSKPPSAAPKKIFVNNIGSGVATIHWTAPPWDKMNGELLGFRLVISVIEGLYLNSIDVDKTSQSFQLSELIPETKYSVRIQALTRGGQGPLSDTVTFDTKRSDNKHDINFRPKKKQRLNKNDPNAFKEDLTVQHPGEINNWMAKGHNTSITLQWSHPNKGGPVKRYKIKWGKVYPGPNEVTLQYPSSSYVIENLDLRTEYMIKIIPNNDVADGKELLFSQFTGSVDIKKIPIPLNLGLKNIGMDSAIISWEDPSNDLSNTRLYQVRYNTLDKDFHITLMKNTTENNVQITGLLPSTSYAFSVRTGDVAPPREGDYVDKEWTWSEWSLKETFSTVGEKPKNSPQDFAIATLGKPDVRNNDVYTKVLVSWSLPDTKSSRKHDEILEYTIYFTESPRIEQENWHTQILPKDQFSSEVSLSGKEKIYYFRVGCRTTNFKCPISKIILYKTADENGQNYGILKIPMEYSYSLDIPAKYLNANPVSSDEVLIQSSKSLSRDILWLIFGVIFGGLVFLIMLMIIICICCRKRSKTPFTGYKLGKKTSNQRIGGAGLLLSNQSPAISNGKVSPHFPTGYTQQLKTPDLFAHSDPHFVDLESDSNQDNDSLRFASVSQHHLASTTTCANMFNPTIQNSLMRSHPQMTYYPDMAAHGKTSINSTAVINPLININSISIPNQVSDSSLQRMQQQNVIYPFSGHPFTQHLINAGSSMPICSSSCMQPIHLSPHMLANQPHDIHNTTSYSNTPRVNASELASHTSSEDIRPLMHSSRVSDSDVSQYYGSATNSTVKSHKGKVDNSSKKPNMDCQRSSEAPKKVVERDSIENDVAKGFSTEELSQEMANLEGLMKDLNAITQKEFEC